MTIRKLCQAVLAVGLCIGFAALVFTIPPNGGI
jgi:hypothetical protein